MADSARSVVRGWLRDQIRERDEIEVPDLADRAINHFKADGQFLEMFMAEMLPSVISDMAYAIFQRSRHDALRVGSKVMSREAFDREAMRRSRFRGWMEHAGDRHISLYALTRATGKIAAAERRERGGEEYRRAEFIERLTERLRGKQTVADKWSDEEIEALADEVWKESA
jgi:hypothetical protein